VSEKRGQPPKQKFKFEPWDGLCDIYVGDKKVREAHPAHHGHVYFHLPPDYPDEVTAEPFDPRVKIQAIIEGGCVIPTEEDKKAAEEAAAEAKRQRDIKLRAEEARRIERAEQEATAKKVADARVAAALAKKAKADKEAADAEKAISPAD
jgi:uncharacterized protein with gpF-like domain